MPLPPIRLGQRYSVRVVDEGGERRDLVGTLVAAEASTWTLLPEDRGPEVVEVAAVRGMRAVPPRVVRPASSADAVQRIAARGWPGSAQRRLGGWLLRFGGGDTKRANSVLVAGTLDRPLGDAIEAVRDAYEAEGLRPTAQISFPLTGPTDPATDVDAELARRGWELVEPSITYVADLRRLPALTPGPAPEVRTSWRDAPSPEWSALADADRRGPAKDVLTAAPARYLVLTGADDGRPVARARLAIVDDWGGVSDVVVAPALRRRGLGRAAMDAVVVEARRLGLRFGYLQVVQANTAAVGLYDAGGWRPHHRYHYRVAPARG